MSKAVDILNGYGFKTFDNFCATHDFSFCDINRCIAKCKVLYNRGDLNERPLPDRMKQERWHFYINVFKYEPRKARELLKAIDLSYQNQFTPRFDPEKITGGIKDVE